MLERQKQGIKAAKEKGVYKGKPQEYSATAKDKKKGQYIMLLLLT